MGIKYTTAGESHGQALVVIVEGIPAGVRISTDDIRSELAARRGGVGRGERQKFEQDNVTILSGVIHGVTIASPIAILIENSEWEKWDQIMSPDIVNSTDIEQKQPNMPVGEEDDRLVKPRPGHADLEGIIKYGFRDARPVLERASARETAGRVAAGALAKAFIRQSFSTEINAKVVQFGTVKREPDQSDADFDALATAFAIKAHANNETIGGVVEVQAINPPRSLGSYISADERLDAAIAKALMSIQAVKGVEIGDGFSIANTLGSNAHDHIMLHSQHPTSASPTDLARETNHAGGIEGGISNGQPIVARIAIKPIPSVPGGLPTVNLSTGEVASGHSQRSDISAVYPARIVAEAELALVIADFITRRYGNDILPNSASL